MNDRIQIKLSQVPPDPGVYLFKDEKGKVIYVGKAQDLRKRLISYFGRPGQLDIKNRTLVKHLSLFDTIITGTEKEALLLESSLIKKYKPKYNIEFKDDKRYPSLRMDIRMPYPTLAIVRKIKNDGALYFGPFASAQSVRQTLRIIQKTFKLRKCQTKEFRNRSRPCLNFQMGLCLAPCCLDVDKGTYNKIVKEVLLFLKGRTPFLIQQIKKEMISAAKVQNYEAAATLRDKMFALERTLEKQISVSTDFKDRDVLAMARSPGQSVITRLLIRNGFLLGSQHFSFTETISTEDELIGSFIRQYYAGTHFIPPEILIPVFVEDAPLIEEWLKDMKGQKVRIIFPKRGKKMRLVNMGIQNAKNELQHLNALGAAEKDMLIRLQKRLKMSHMIERIECFDNSNISGTLPVASMVVFENGKSKKSAYRKYKIKTVKGQNDYAYLAEVLKRRYGKKEASLPFPDLLLLDGGKGQLNTALAILRRLHLKQDLEVIAIAKKDEKKGETQDKIYIPGRANPLNFGRERDLLHFLQQIRNEAHRFAISFHRKQRTKTAMRSALDAIPGIGKKRKETLLKHFKSIQKIKNASPADLSALPGMTRTAAEALKAGLRN